MLVDTNVVLDLLLEREPFAQAAREIFSKVENKRVEGFLCATTITTIYYLVSKAKGRQSADQIISTLLKLFNIAAVTKEVLQEAVGLEIKDFEDAVIISSALQIHAQTIITRNIKDFAQSKITVYEPDEFVRMTSTNFEAK